MPLIAMLRMSVALYQKTHLATYWQCSNENEFRNFGSSAKMRMQSSPTEF